MATIATVASIAGSGTVYAVNALGVQRIVKAGDVLEKGETLRTVGDATVELLMDDGNLLAIAPDKTVRLDDNVSQSDTLPTAADSAITSTATSETIIQALERGTDLSTTLDATAAGLDGGGGGGNSFVQLMRISEGVDAQSYNFNFSALGVMPIDVGIGVVAIASNTVTVPAVNNTPGGPTASDIPATVTASIAVNPIAGDGIINGAEVLAVRTLISGTVGGDVKAGDSVTIFANGHTTTTTVTADDKGVLVFNAEVSTADLAVDSTVEVSVTTTSADGSATSTATAVAVVAFDTVITQPTIALVHDTAPGADNGDGVTKTANLNISAPEVGTTRVITVDGQVVSSYDPASLKDGSHTANVTDTDVAGNTKSADFAFILDTIATATISINSIGNDLITAAQATAGGNVTVTGIVGGDAKVNDVVTVTVNGHETTGVVAQGPTELVFSAQVAVADLVADKTIDAKITATDAAGNTFTSTAQHSVTGESVAGNDARSVTEDLVPTPTDGLLTTSGVVTVASSSGLANAVDPATTVLVTHTVTSKGVTNDTPELGTLTVHADGSYDFNVSNSAVQFLGQGDKIVQTYDVKTADGTATSTITITINGTNDLPTFSSGAGQDAGGVTEDATTPLLSTTGTLVVSDADHGQSRIDIGVSPVSSAGALGSISINAQGQWTYSVDNSKVQYLGADESKVETFTVKSNDGTSHDISVTITGSNDAAVLSSASVQLAETNAPLSTGGQLSISDVDSAQTFQAQSNVSGAHGSFSIGTDGQWNYIANSANDNLNVGESVSDTFTVKSADGTATSVTVTINGTNDAAVIGGVSTGAVQEDTDAPSDYLNTSGVLTIADVDLGQSSFAPQTSAAGTYGTFTLSSDGHWTYTADNTQTAIQQLGASQSIEDSFTAVSSDGTANQVVTVTINGTNDAAVIGGVSTGAVQEDISVVSNHLNTSGLLTIADVDLGQSSFAPQTSAAGTYGTFTLTSDGHWTYTADNTQAAIQQLGETQSIQDSFTAVSLDGTANQIVTVTINGTNDMPVIGGVSTVAVQEDTGAPIDQLNTNGLLTIADADLGQSSFAPQVSAAGTYGTFTLAADGHWTYTADNMQAAIQQLGATQSIEDSFTAVSSDGTANQVVTVTINGTNDAAVIGGVSTGAVQEDTDAPSDYLNTSGVLTIADVDLGQSSFAPQSSAVGTYGTFTLTSDGHWTYTVDNTQAVIQLLGATQSIEDSFTAVSSDGTANQVVTVTINGTNDAAVIGGVSTGAVQEDTGASIDQLNTSGVLTIADADLGQSSFAPQTSAAGTYGTFTLVADGHWTYTADNTQAAIQQLGATQSIEDSFTAVSSDGTANQIVTVTINGTNDAAVIGGVSTGAVQEDISVVSNHLNTSGVLTIADVDLGQSNFVPQTSAAGSYGTFTLAADGHWTYTADNMQAAIQLLGATQSIEDSFTAVSSDGTANQVVTVTINGTNDAAVIGGVSTGAVQEDISVVSNHLNTSGVLTIADADLGQSSFAPQTSAAGTYGTFTLVADGHWTYTADNTQAAIQQLGASQSIEDSFTAVSSDGTANQVVTVTINGTNDKPTITADSGNSGNAHDVVDEALLPGGSLQLGGNVIHVTDTTNVVNIADQINGQSITIGNATVPLDQLVNHDFVMGEGYVLHINSFDPITGDIGYTFSAAPVVTGTFAVADADGINDIKSISVNGVEVPIENLATHDFTLSHGTLHIENYDAAIGVSSYTYTLTSALNSADGAGAKVVVGGETFAVTVKDIAGLSNTATIAIDVKDDAPVTDLTGKEIVVSEGGHRVVGNDVVLIIDRSGSMAGSELTNLKASIKTMFDSGSVHSVFITSFSDTATVHASAVAGSGGWFTDMNEAFKAVNAIQAGGSTDYDLALKTVTTNFAPPPAGGEQLVSIFISDGQPNTASNRSSPGIVGAEETNWYGFLQTHGFSNSYAVGFSGLTAADKGYLEPIAWHAPEVAGTYAGAADPNVMVVVQASDVANALLTMVSLSHTVTGNVLSGELGADQPFSLVSVTLVDSTYVFDSTHTSFTIDTTAGSLTIKSTGEYSFTGVSSVGASGQSVGLDYVIRDADGDTAQRVLNLTVTDGVPTAVADSAVATEGHWKLASGNTTDSINYVAPGYWGAATTTTHPSVGNSSQLDPIAGGGSKQVDTNSFAIKADAAHAASISVNISFAGKTGLDTLSLALFDAQSNLQIGAAKAVAANGNSSALVSFTSITTNGSYFVRAMGAEGSGSDSGNFKFNFSSGNNAVTVKQFAYTDDAIATINISTPNLSWVAGPTSKGNVLTNDLAGTNGGLHLTGVAISADIPTTIVVAPAAAVDVTGSYGTLHIGSNGAYTYTPGSGDFQPGAVDHFTYTVADANGNESTAELSVALNNYAYANASGSTLIAGSDGNDNLLGNGSSEVLYGGWGNDTLTGGGGNDRLIGGAGNDTLVAGGLGSNVLIGGAGNDVMTGSAAGVDVFKWALADQGVADAPAIDNITNFNTASIPNGGDVLDLRDLLQGEHSATVMGVAATGSLDQYLNFELLGGKLALDVHDPLNAGHITQKIVLDNVTGGTLDAAIDSLAHSLGMTGTHISDADLLKKLVDTGHLKTDV